MTRADTLRSLEREVGVMIRRVRRLIRERAHSVHPDLQPASYLLLASIAQSGPVRASVLVEQFDIDKGAISRQVTHLVDLGLLASVKDPDDGRATLLSLTDEAVRRMADVAEHRHRLLDETLSDWTAEELEGFVGELNRYNTALNLGLAQRTQAAV